MKYPLALALALLVSSAQAATQDTTWQYTPYSNEVNDIQIFRRSPNPLLWLGTNHGVVRIKGTDTLWLHPTNSKLPHEIIDPNSHSQYDFQRTFTALDSAGNYWIGYRQRHKLVRIDTLGGITVFDSSATAPIKDLGGLSATRTHLYFGNQDGNVYSRPTTSNGIWSQVPGANTLDAGIRLTALEARNDTLWIGYDGDANGNLRYVPLTSGAAGRFTSSTGERVVGSVFGIWHSEAPSNNSLYLRVSRVGSYAMLENDTLFTVRAGNVVTKSLGDEAGSLVHIRSHGDYPSFHKANGTTLVMNATGYSFGGAFPEGVVTGARDTALSFFLGTGSRDLNGFYKLFMNRSNGWGNISYGPTLRGNAIVGSAAGTGGTLYLATDLGVYKRTDATPSLSLIYAPVGGRILCISLDSAGRLAIGQSNGLFRWNGGNTTYVTALSDSIVAMAHSKTYSWYYTRSAGNLTKLWVYTSGVTAPSQVPLTGIGPDSVLVTKMRAVDDNTLWVLANGRILTWTTVSWKNWVGIDITGNGPGSGTFGDFDLAGNRLWTSFQTKDQMFAFSWGAAGMADNSLVASGTEISRLNTPVLAESEASAWYYNPSMTSRGLLFLGPSSLLQMSTTDKKVVASISSATSNLHQGLMAAGQPLLSDKDGGLWVVMTDGLSRMKVTRQVAVGVPAPQPALQTRLASVRAGRLSLSLPQACAVRVQVASPDGRLLEVHNLGLLSAGEHALTLGKAHGLRIVRIQAGDRSQTLPLAAP